MSDRVVFLFQGRRNYVVGPYVLVVLLVTRCFRGCPCASVTTLLLIYSDVCIEQPESISVLQKVRVSSLPIGEIVC